MQRALKEAIGLADIESIKSGYGKIDVSHTSFMLRYYVHGNPNGGGVTHLTEELWQRA
jgi:hypothetical protein